MQTEKMVFLNRIFSQAPTRVREHAATAPGQALTERMKQDVEWFSKHFEDDPKRQSGWGHAYFCPEDGSFLAFDRISPAAHRCPVCGRVSSEKLHNDAWVYLYRYEAVLSACEAAVLYQVDTKQEYLSHMMRIIGFYSDHYSEFESHACGPKTSGAGKIAPQALNEAIFITRITQALEQVRDALPQDFVEGVCRNLLLPAAEFLHGQRNWINNIPCWINAALTAVGCFTGEKKWVEEAFDARYGMYDQIACGVTESRFWFEGSIHYNCFTLEAFLNQLSFAAQHEEALHGDAVRIVGEMVDAVHDLAFHNTVLPNPNDGWPNLNLKTYSYLFEMASALFGTEHFRAMAQEIYQSSIARTPLPMSFPVYAGDYSMEWMLFAAPASGDALENQESRRSVCFAASDYAVLKKRHCEAFLKYGHCTASHAHPDKMNVELTAFDTVVSRDLSNCGYASRLCDEYYRTSVSHNTVVVDGHSHTTILRGECLSYNEQEPSIDVRIQDAYPGVEFRRSIRVNDAGMEDVFRVSGDEEHTYDWVFHVEGQLCSSIAGEPAQLDYSGDGYQHLSDVRRISGSGDFRLEWGFAKNSVRGEQTLRAENAELYLCESYDNPASRRRFTLILRVKGKDACFSQTWNFCREDGEKPQDAGNGGEK